MDNAFEEQLEGIRKLIYQYKIREALDNTIKLLEQLENSSRLFNEEQKTKYKNIVNYIYTSMENKDYKVLSDILKFELISLFEVGGI